MKTMLFVPAVTVALLFGCAPKNEFQPPPPPGVTVQAPVKKTVTVYESFPGRLVAHDTVDIRARVKGFLQSIDFTDGQRVKKGDLLFTIEPEQYEAQVSSSEALLAQAQAAQKLAQATLQRTENAYKTKAVSEVDLLTSQANKQAADAAVMEAQAALDNAKLNLSYTRIHAPLDGRLARRALSVGNLVGDGQSTLLTTLVVEAPIDVFFNVDERAMLPFLQKGIRNEIPKISTLPPVKLELADGSFHDGTGTVNYIDPAFDPETGTAQARAIFENADYKLIPGLYGNILIPRMIEDALLVPDLAVQQDMAGSYVLTVNSSNIVESVYVVKGPLVDTERVVEKDPTKDRYLTVEDRVVVNGLQRARPGIPVTATEAQATAEAPASN
ncbi:efflux RND transporter periplasmic adaptor subunit [Pontiellaceae bacterium B12219]|nr:efflux RND transporter periplasmic adaptor subunit [Pontiellaceae bacterium B12219]